MKTIKQTRLLQLKYWFKNIVIPEIKETERLHKQWEKKYIEEKKEMAKDV